MELICGLYITKRDYTATEKGELSIRKGSELLVPDLCGHRERVVALQLKPNDVGFVNRNFMEIKSKHGERTLRMVFAHGIAIRNHNPKNPSDCLSYMAGHLIMLSPGPYSDSGVVYANSLVPCVKVFNLTTASLGYIPFNDFHWYPNAEVTTDTVHALGENGVYSYQEGIIGARGDKLVAWDSREISGEQFHHGIRISTGTVGYWKGISWLGYKQQKKLQHKVEEAAQREIPKGSNLRELVRKWAQVNEVAPQMQALNLDSSPHAPEAVSNPSMAVLVPSSIDITPPHYFPSQYPLFQPSQYPEITSQPKVYVLMPNEQPIPSTDSFDPNLPCAPTVPAVHQSPTITSSQIHSSGTSKSIHTNPGGFGPYDDAPPKWDFVPDLSLLSVYSDNIENQIGGEEEVKCAWRKVQDYELDLNVGDKIAKVAKWDFGNGWGLNSWIGYAKGQCIVFPSCVVGAVNRLDKTRGAEIYDIALIRGGVCAKHPSHERSLRCCISYTATFEACALRDLSREHMCCCGDWAIAGQKFNEATGGQQH